MKFRKSPEAILKEVGIFQPEDIDLDLVAYSLSAEVKRASLSDCEGYIIGTDNRAVITINEDVSEPRQRFSLGHELGHWVNDKGKNLTYRCDLNDMNRMKADKTDFRAQKELRANTFAAELLVPQHIAQPYLHGLDIDFDTVEHLSHLFSVSITSSAIRLVELSEAPCMVVCWNSAGQRLWYARNSDVPETLRPHQRINIKGFDWSNGKAEEVDADIWIDKKGSEEYTVFQSLLYNGYTSFSLIWWKDESQLLDLI